jgi:hypothetical protein
VWQPEEFLAHAKPAEVQVRLRNASQMRNVPPIFVANPHLIGDTLRGTGLDGGSVALAWADVVDVYARQLDSKRTVIGVAGVTLLSGLVVYAFVQDADGAPGPSTCIIPPGSYDHDLDDECSRP